MTSSTLGRAGRCVEDSAARETRPTPVQLDVPSGGAFGWFPVFLLLQIGLQETTACIRLFLFLPVFVFILLFLGRNSPKYKKLLPTTCRGQIYALYQAWL